MAVVAPFRFWIVAVKVARLYVDAVVAVPNDSVSVEARSLVITLLAVIVTGPGKARLCGPVGSTSTPVPVFGALIAKKPAESVTALAMTRSAPTAANCAGELPPELPLMVIVPLPYGPEVIEPGFPTELTPISVNSPAPS